MFKKAVLFSVILLFVFSGAVSTFAGAEKDEEGSKDHPMISRFAGSVIRAYEHFNYDRLKLATGMEEDEVEKTAFEGEVTRIVYKGPEGHSSLEIYRNYQMALKEAGFQILFECIDDHQKCMKFAPFEIDGFKYGEVAGMGKDARYLFARLDAPDGDILVSVHTAVAGGSTPYTLFQVVEKKTMDTGKVQVDIDAYKTTEDIDEKESVDQEQEDEEGSKDHPMISRFAGSVIRAYEHFNYDRLKLATGMKEDEVEKTAFEGEVTRIVYKGPEGHSSLEIYRNYQTALKEAGFQILFECIDDHQKCMKFAPFEIDGFKYGEVAGMGKDARYLFARINAPDGDILVSVHTAVAGGSTSYTLFQVVEKKTMDTGKVQVDIDAEKMAEDIDKKGSVSIYGILFDTDKAKIKEKSESTMTEIASLLEQKSDLRLYIVGHTDATGSLEYNMNLSRKRAKAVVNYLTSKHEIRQERLIPRGVGPLAPVASNETEEGRARNRRVELVKMPEQ